MARGATEAGEPPAASVLVLIGRHLDEEALRRDGPIVLPARDLHTAPRTKGHNLQNIFFNGLRS